MTRVVVIGAGIVGTATAYQLARSGCSVTIVDRGAPGAGASHGNAGGIVPGAIPLGTLKNLMGAPKRLLDRNDALVLRWRDWTTVVPWLVRLIAQSAPGRAEANSEALYALTSAAPDAWRDLIKGTPAQDLFLPRGWLKVYDTAHGIAGTKDLLALLDRRGAPYEVLDQDALRQYEPTISHRFKGGVLQPNAMFCTNPRRLVETLMQEATSAGAEFRQSLVTDIELSETLPAVHLEDGSILAADRIVLAAGAHSGALAARCGSPVPLIAERGYHVMFDSPDETPRGPVVWEERDFVICPMETGVRATSITEFSKPDTPADFRRIERITAQANQLLPSLGERKPRERWMGRRPSLPDSLPIIGPSERDERVLFAFGHNHYGLTLAAITANLVNCMVRNTAPPFPLMAYRSLR